VHSRGRVPARGEKRRAVHSRGMAPEMTARAVRGTVQQRAAYRPPRAAAVERPQTAQ